MYGPEFDIKSVYVFEIFDLHDMNDPSKKAL